MFKVVKTSAEPIIDNGERVEILGTLDDGREQINICRLKDGRLAAFISKQNIAPFMMMKFPEQVIKAMNSFCI